MQIRGIGIVEMGSGLVSLGRGGVFGFLSWIRWGWLGCGCVGLGIAAMTFLTMTERYDGGARERLDGGCGYGFHH